MTPSVRFGNYAPEASVKLCDFATHGQEILGGQEPWANCMGREIVYNFWNQLQLCNLDLGVDVGKILPSITFKNRAGEQVPLKALPFHPVKDAEMIALKRSHYEYLRQRCKLMRIYIEKHQFLQFRECHCNKDYDPTQDLNTLYVEWHPCSSIPAGATPTSGLPAVGTDLRGQVVKILKPIRIHGEVRISGICVPSRNLLSV